MLQIVKSLCRCFFLFVKEADVRKAIFRPAFKTLKIYLFSFVLTICLVLAYFMTGESAESFWMLLVSVSGSLLILLIVPVIISYIYLSFLCDRYYQVIIGRIVPLENININEKNDAAGFFSITFCALILLLVLLLSMIVPLLSIVLGGFIFGADIFSQTLSCLKYSYRQQASYVFGYILPITVLGVILLGLSLFPFAVLIVYPFGVMVAADFYEKKSHRRCSPIAIARRSGNT